MPMPLSPYMLKGGITYAPRAGEALTGQVIANYVKALSTAYPDFSLETIVAGTPEEAWSPPNGIDDTHIGPLMDGTPATGRNVAYPIATFTQVEGDKIP